MKEIWKDIKGFEGLYKVSTIGNVKSLSRTVSHYKGSQNIKGRLLKPLSDGRGYKQVILYKNGNTFKHRIHRLVAEAFIPKVENKLFVNHIDCDKGNNNVVNLEWCSQKENVHHASAAGLGKVKIKPVIAANYLGQNIMFSSVVEAALFTGGNNGNIASCARGERNKANGYKWRYI